MIRSTIRCSLLLAIALLPAFAKADVPTDAQVAAVAALYKANGKRNLDGIPDPTLVETLKDISLAELTLPQLHQLKQAGILAQVNEAQCAAIRGRLSELAKSPDATGADAAILQLEVTPRLRRGLSKHEVAAIQREGADVLREAIRHPGLTALLREKRGFEVYLHVFFKQDELGRDRPCLKALADKVNCFDGAGNVRSLLAFQEVASDSASPLSKTDKSRVTRYARKNLAVALKDTTLLATERKYLSHQMERLMGAAENGRLIGRVAPKIDFLWTAGPAGGPNVRNFSAFRGKVVVMDCWATWCGPCIDAFPLMRRLQETYRNEPVVFLGVTSPQGRMGFPYAKNGVPEPIRSLNVDREIALLPEWTHNMEMTWTIACSRQDVFNPDFGVKSIPYVAILDAKGVVRYASLELEDPTLEAKLEGLLKETSAL